MVKTTTNQNGDMAKRSKPRLGLLPNIGKSLAVFDLPVGFGQFNHPQVEDNTVTDDRK